MPPRNKIWPRFTAHLRSILPPRHVTLVSKGHGEVANSLGEEAGLEARGYRSAKADTKASRRAFDRAMIGAPPEKYRPEQYPKWIDAPGHEPIQVADAEAETRMRRSWGEEVPEPAAATPLSEEFKDFLAWKESRANKHPRSPAAK